VPNLYVRDNLRTAGAMTSELATACPACSSPLPAPTFSQFGGIPVELPILAGTSQDLTHVVYESRQNLTTDATGPEQKLYEADHGTVRLAGILPDGSAAPNSVAGWGASIFFYTPHVISQDGSRVIFTTDATDCAFGQICGGLYMRIAHTETVHLNASERTDCADHTPCSGAPEQDPGGPQAASYQDASVDGARVFFTSQEALTDDAPLSSSSPKLYMYDASKPDSDPHNLTFLSADHETADGINNAIGTVALSDDGHYAYFIADGQLVAGAPTGGDTPDIFLWHDGSLRFVSAMPSQGDVLQAVNAPFDLNPKIARVTPDGQHLLFSSSATVGPTGRAQGSCGENNGGPGCLELYLYSAVSGDVQCVSCPQAGTVPSANTVEEIRVNVGASLNTWHLSRSLSGDGDRVSFSTAEPLVPGDTNGKSDAYEWEADRTGTCQRPDGCLELISSGTDPSDSYFMDASASGNDVFFTTHQRLLGWDTDNNVDLYDARVGGGFPGPPTTVPACSADACQGPPVLPPAFDTPPSATFSGPRNLTPPTPVSPAKPKTLTKAQLLAKALKACRKKHNKHKRLSCEKQAHKRYPSKSSKGRK
jgi:hypothetical protein